MSIPFGSLQIFKTLWTGTSVTCTSAFVFQVVFALFQNTLGGHLGDMHQCLRLSGQVYMEGHLGDMHQCLQPKRSKTSWKSLGLANLRGGGPAIYVNTISEEYLKFKVHHLAPFHVQSAACTLCDSATGSAVNSNLESKLESSWSLGLQHSCQLHYYTRIEHG